MKSGVPTVTVIIAARPSLTSIPAVEAAKQLDYPADKIQILVARGRQPSVQRNVAAKRATGDWIYFLDDDSCPPTGTLRVWLKVISHDDAVIVGGPNLCPPSAPRLELAFAATMANRLAFGPSVARYSAVGQTRSTDEKELILCNLLIRRDLFLAEGGFDESLYPNEENALMDRIRQKGYGLYYEPELYVYRSPRSNARAFAKMVFTYGRGRAEQVRLHPTWGSLPNLIPSSFLIYMIALPWLPAWYAGGLVFYLLLLFGSVLHSPNLGPRASSASPSEDRFEPPSINSKPSIMAVTCLVVLTHLGYGIGFLRGLFTRLRGQKKMDAIEVQIEEFTPPTTKLDLTKPTEASHGLERKD